MGRQTSLNQSFGQIPGPLAGPSPTVPNMTKTHNKTHKTQDRHPPVPAECQNKTMERPESLEMVSMIE